MRTNFERDLERLQQQLCEMGTAVDETIESTIAALKQHDRELAGKIARSDDEIDQMEHQIEMMCMNLIARQQPLARDLRIIAATLKIITDIERVADQCADICEIVANIENIQSFAPVNHLAKMMETARGMFSRSITAYMQRDIETSREICESDDVVDEQFQKVVMELSGLISAGETSIMKIVHLMFVAKYIERVADHATNIAEWTIYMAEGMHPSLNHGVEPTIHG